MKPSQLTDVNAWNKKHGVIWILYGIIIVFSSVVSSFLGDGNGDEIFCFDRNENIVLLDYYETGEITTLEGSFSECLIKQIEELDTK